MNELVNMWVIVDGAKFIFIRVPRNPKLNLK